MVQLLVLFFSFCSFLTPSSDSISNEGAKELFSIGRSKDPDEIFYRVKLKNDHLLNLEEPIEVYWIKHTEGDKYVPLSWVQKNWSYGVEYLELRSDFAKFHFAGYSKRTFELRKNSEGVFKVYTTSNNKVVEVQRIFIHIAGGTFWVPQIPKVELHTYNEKTHKKEIELIYP